MLNYFCFVLQMVKGAKTTLNDTAVRKKFLS